MPWLMSISVQMCGLHGLQVLWSPATTTPPHGRSAPHATLRHSASHRSTTTAHCARLAFFQRRRRAPCGSPACWSCTPASACTACCGRQRSIPSLGITPTASASRLPRPGTPGATTGTSSSSGSSSGRRFWHWRGTSTRWVGSGGVWDTGSGNGWWRFVPVSLRGISTGNPS